MSETEKLLQEPEYRKILKEIIYEVIRKDLWIKSSFGDPYGDGGKCLTIELMLGDNMIDKTMEWL